MTGLPVRAYATLPASGRPARFWRIVKPALPIALTVLVAAPPATVQSTYRVTRVGAGTEAQGINARGDVVGSVQTAAGRRAFL